MPNIVDDPTFEPAIERILQRVVPPLVHSIVRSIVREEIKEMSDKFMVMTLEFEKNRLSHNEILSSVHDAITGKLV